MSFRGAPPISGVPEIGIMVPFGASRNDGGEFGAT